MRGLSWTAAILLLLTPTPAALLLLATPNGAGGQNVNKVSSKCECRLDLSACPWPQGVIERLRAGGATSGGQVVVTSDRHRTQSANRKNAVERLASRVAEAWAPPKTRRQRVGISSKGKAARRDQKQRTAQKKRDRSNSKRGIFDCSGPPSWSPCPLLHTPRRRLMAPLLAAACCANVDRRARGLLPPRAYAAAAAATATNSNADAGAAAAAAAEGESLPAGAVILRVAEVTDFQERLLRRAASLSEAERAREGLGFAREQLILSVDILLRNTRLGELPGGGAPALTLYAVRRVASQASGPLSSPELLLIASTYARARDELRVAFEALPAEEQRRGREVARRLRAADDERIREARREAEEAEARS